MVSVLLYIPHSTVQGNLEGEDMDAMTDFTFFGSMITADGDSNHEIKRHLLLGRKAMTNLDSILKSRDITVPTKVCIVKATVFPIVENKESCQLSVN